MNAISLHKELTEFAQKSLPVVADLKALQNSKDLLVVARELSPLDSFKSETVALLNLGQAIDVMRVVLTDRLENIEAVRRARAMGKSDLVEQAWHERGSKRIVSSKRFEKLIPEFTKSFRLKRDNLRANIKLRLDEFQGDVNQYVSTEFVQDNSNTIFGLNEKLVAGLSSRAVDFAQMLSPALCEFSQSATDQVAQIVGFGLPNPVNMKFCSELGDFGFVEDAMFEKFMGLNSALRISDMNMDVVGLGTLGKWLAIGKAPQYVREQHMRKNITQVRNFSRQFASDFSRSVKLNLDRLEIYLLSQLDTAHRGNRALIGFLRAKPLLLQERPPKLNLDKIAALDTKRLMHMLGRITELRQRLNGCYRKLSNTIRGEQ